MTVLQQVPVDRISVEARALHAGRVLLTLLAGVLYGLGWIVAKSLALGWLAIAWSATAVKVGYVEGSGKHRKAPGS